jgi:acyl-CoA dehydrogenase
MERQALAALDALAGDTDPDEKDLHQQKLVVARFYGEHLLPQVSGLLPAVTAGKDLLFALDADAL